MMQQRSDIKKIRKESSSIVRNKHQFEQVLQELKARINLIDKDFLTKLSHTIGLKSPIFSQQISSLVIVIVLGAIATNKPDLIKKQDLSGYTILRIEELSELMGEYKGQLCLNLTQPEMIGWTSEIWDRIVHSSCFRNHIDLLVLLYFIAGSLLQYEKQLKRIVRLLLRSFSKIKTIYSDTIQLAISLIDHFIKVCEDHKFSFDLKVRLKILKLMYLSKIENPNEEQYEVILSNLDKFLNNQLEYFADIINKNEQQGTVRQEDGIWDSLFVIILRNFHRKVPLQTVSRKMLIEMINVKIDMQIVKLMIRQLQVNNQPDPLTKWKNVFGLLQLALKIYDRPRTVASFLNSKSYIKIPLNAGKIFLLQIQLKNSWKTYEQEKFMLMIQDKNRKQELWVTTINEKEGELRLILLRVSNRTIMEPTQQLITWDQNKTANLRIIFTAKQIKIQVNQLPQNVISIQRFLESPAFLVVGDCDSTLGTSVKYFNTLSYAPNSVNQEDLLCYKIDLNNKNTEAKGVKKKSLPSFVEIFLALGDLDAFLLIVSHAIKKMKNDPLLTNMIRVSLSILEGFVHVKKVSKVPLTAQQKEERLNAVLCLCWQCSHQAKNALPVLQLLRVLSVRGIPNYDDQLQVLCNFAFWKSFDWQYQRLLILKIKQILLHGRYDDSYIKHFHRFGKIILMEAILYYRQEDTLNNVEDKQHILKIHYEFIALIQDQLIHQINTNKQLSLVYEFIQFLIKAISLTISRKSYKSIEAFDLAMSIQLSFLVKNVGVLLKKLTISRQKLGKIVKCILQVCYMYNSEGIYFQDKLVSIFNSEKGFQSFDHTVIKDNLYQLAYRFLAFCPSMLYTMIDLDEDGIDPIICICWQEQFLNKISSQDLEKSSIVHEDTDHLRTIYKKLPKRCLSNEQLKKIVKIYLIKDSIFPKIDIELTNQIWKKVGVSDTLVTIKKQLFHNSKEESQLTETSKLDLGPCKNISLFKAKIIHLLASQERLSGHQGLSILNTMKLLFPLCNNEQFRLLLCHFTLKELVDKTKLIKKSQQSSISFKSYIDVETRPSTSLISGYGEDSSTREDYTQCLEYYLSRVHLRKIMEINSMMTAQEAQQYLENIKNELSIMMNILCGYNFNCTNQLKKYDNFLENKILQISKHFLKQLTMEKKKDESSQLQKRKSTKDAEWPIFDMKDQVKNMFSAFIDDRNQNLLKVEKTWNKIEERNKYFWNTFLPKDTVFTLYEGTGIMNERYMLKKKNKKQKLELPRMHRTSLSRSASIMSQKFDFNETESVSSIFEDAHLYRKDPKSCLDDRKEIPIKEGKINKFNVLLITPSKIYQGMIVVTSKKLTFIQNEVIDFQLYKKIYASECEQRNQDECIRQNYKVEEQLTPQCLAISKRYLFHDIGLQIHTINRSYFFSFMKKDSRKACIFILKEYIRVISRQTVEEEAKRMSQMWENGEISNYQYLMKINDIAGRSFNDLSQYYIFPWTVVNFNDQINHDFFKNKNNFRDLSVPVGKLSKSKWDNIKKNYERSKKEQIMGMKPFLYGSFYSNPAIVSNFLIRINPFASQHFQLQSHSFDLADRLFYSVKDSYQSLMNCSSDFKELIPEFYFFPQFLKNRNEYNLGSRQNKDIVNNVILPNWAQDEYEFVFRMRKFLESQVITEGLNGWIDLIFGVYTKKEYAIRADNLFLDQLYIDSFRMHAEDKNKECVMYFKEFGQVPVSVFTSNHRPSHVKQNFLDLLTHESMNKEQFSFHNGIQSGRFQHLFFSTKFTFVLFEKQIRMYIDDKFGDKDYVSINGEFEGGTLKMWKMTDEKNKSHHCLLFHRRKTSQLIGFQIRRNMFNSFVIEGGQILQFKHKVELFAIYNNILICSEGKNIYMYKNVQEEVEEEYSSKNNSISISINKNKYLLGVFCQFTQHRARVLFVKVSPRGMIVTLDEEGKIYITEIHSGKISIYNYFEIRNTCFQQKIIELIVHNYGMIIMRTDYGRLLTFTFLGDRIVDQILHFKRQNENDLTQKMKSMHIWNPEFPELVVGTNRGNLWKLDIFTLRKKEQVTETDIWIEKLNLSKEGFRKEGILRLAVSRLGRHSLLLAYGQNGKLYSVRSQRWDEVRKGYLSGKKTMR